MDENIYRLQNQYSSHYVEWIPHNIKTAICDIATYNTKISATSLSNTTAIQEVFTTLLNKFQEMFKSKAYLNFYLSEGMEESDFLEAQNSLSSLISEYQQYQNAVANTAFVEEFRSYVEDWTESDAVSIYTYICIKSAKKELYELIIVWIHTFSF